MYKHRPVQTHVNQVLAIELHRQLPRPVQIRQRSCVQGNGMLSCRPANGTEHLGSWRWEDVMRTVCIFALGLSIAVRMSVLAGVMA